MATKQDQSLEGYLPTAEAGGDGEAARLNAFLDSIIDNIPTMVFVKDAVTLRYELFNRAGEELSGFSRHDVYGKDDTQLFSKEVAAFFQEKDREVLRGGRLLDIPEEQIETKAGTRWLHTKKIPILDPDGTPRHLLGISLDITDRKLAVEGLQKAHEELGARVLERTRELVDANAQLQREIDERRRTEAALRQAEQQLRHAQKMEAVGRLAGGIAHDFNNLLSVVMSYAAILAAGVDPSTQLAQGLEEIRKAGDRAAVLTRQLLAFSRQQVLAPQVVNLNQVIGRMDNMLRRVIGDDIELVTQPAADLGCTKIDPGQLEQVVMNLVVNARDAMPDGGKVSIATSNVDLDPDHPALHAGLAHGSYVVLAVTDTGVGMDELTQSRVFEPFFTTKERGKGTGLGLSTVFGIVQQSGGHVAVESAPNAGATFKVYLARTDDVAAAGPDPPPVAPSSRGTETILLVEDEPLVLELAHCTLEQLGYKVLP
ncbi:MAG TPA: ATP-binding protein, partial [Polyangia bacterium]|nr:ATP-binding protein [Polyangia bacterium]